MGVVITTAAVILMTNAMIQLLMPMEVLAVMLVVFKTAECVGLLAIHHVVQCKVQLPRQPQVPRPLNNQIPGDAVMTTLKLMIIAMTQEVIPMVALDVMLVAFETVEFVGLVFIQLVSMG